jgi:hypothetical protein
MSLVNTYQLQYGHKLARFLHRLHKFEQYTHEMITCAQALLGKSTSRDNGTRLGNKKEGKSFLA